MNDSTSQTFSPNTKRRKPKPTNKGDWMEYKHPVIVSISAMRGGGKGGISDQIMQSYYDRHFTVLHIFSARSLENLYPMINKNCGFHFDKIRQLMRNKFPHTKHITPCRLRPNEEERYIKEAERAGFIKKSNDRIRMTQDGVDFLNGKLLHCRCREALPILLMIPDYIQFNDDTVDRFNGVFWKDLDEYKEHLSEITTQDKQLLLDGKLKKPTYLRPVPLLKIKHFTVPSTELRIEKFRSEWTDGVVQARDEHRCLIMSPMFFEGQDKFVTLAEIASYHPILMNSSGHFNELTEKDVGKPYKYWSLKQKNHHLMAIFIDEARSVIPSSKLHGESGAGKSKRNLYDKIPEMRHFKTFLYLIFQNPMDIYDGVRSQENFAIFKQTHPRLAGAESQWVFDKIEQDRFGFMRKFTRGQCDKLDKLKSFEKRFPKVTDYIDQRRPRLQELPSDNAYIIKNGYIRLIKNGMGKFHHKQELESFTGDTKITWIVDREKRPDDIVKTKKETKSMAQQMKKVKLDIFKRMRYSVEVEKKDFTSIGADLVQMQVDNIIPDMQYAGKSRTYFSNMYNKMKKRYDDSMPEL
jgi:hypothetical protein